MSLPYTSLTAADVRPSSAGRSLPGQGAAAAGQFFGHHQGSMRSRSAHSSRTMPHNHHRNGGSSSASSHVHRRRQSANHGRKEAADGGGGGSGSGGEIRTALDFCPEETAAQLTITDQKVFRSILPDELSSCSWNKKNKLEVAPNVVALTRRFNHVIFWTVEEVLKRETPKARAEVMSHFVRVAKKLNELNNLHSEFAVLSALQSASIYRLSKTWSCLPRRERQVFEKLTELFSEKDNFARLREHMGSVALRHQPCVPYLGLYLTDLVYIDMAHPAHSGGSLLEPTQRQYKMNNILRIVSELQQSLYPENLTVSPQCVQYLGSIRYIDELQKFIEDDQWKKSLALEPVETSGDVVSAASKDSVNNVVPALVSPSKGGTMPAAGHGNCQKIGGTTSKFIPGHRKTRSEGGSLFFTCGRGLGLAAASSMAGGSTDTVSQLTKGLEAQRHHLLDDSLLDSSAPDYHSSNEKILDSSDPDSKSHSKSSTSELELKNTLSRLTLQSQCIFKGMIRRKPLIKSGRRLTMTGWQRYWIELWGSSLVYYSPKTLTKSTDRKDYKTDPCKCQSITGWFVMIPPPMIDTNCFQLTDPVRKDVYKFRAPSSDVAQVWIHSLQEGIAQAQMAKTNNTNLISFE